MKPLSATGRLAAGWGRWVVVWIALAALPSADLARSAEPANKAPSAKTPSAKKEEDKQPGAFAVPDGTPEEIIQYLQKLGEMRPSAQDEKTLAEFSKRVGAAATEAVDKIFAGKPNEQQAAYAMRLKLEALGMLDRFGDKQAFAKLQSFPGELEKLGWPKLARLAGGVLLQTRLTRAEAAGAEPFKAVLEDVKKFLAAAPLEPQDSELAVGAALAAERVDRAGLAVKAYADFAKLFSASKDERMVRFGAKLQGAARRLALQGQPMEIQGVAPDGKAFNWAQYKGKVVLVAFWATWCQYCRVELGSILKNYEIYHDKGFDVVAVSMDQEKDDLVGFLAENKLPWTVLFDQALRTDAADKTLDTYYGIITLPELILVGSDGKVVTMSVRGPALGRELARLLGPPETPKPKAGDVKKSGPDKKGKPGNE